MAHEITNVDGLVLVGKSAWHGLGTVVEQAPSIGGALQLAGLDWRVEQHELETVRPGGVGKRILTHVANVRSDTGTVLGVVGSGYTPMQNTELAEFAEALMSEGAKVESAGSIREGRRVWFLVRTEEVVELGRTGADKVVPYVLLANGHDGSLAMWVQPTTVRVVCSNTFHIALGSRKADRAAGKALRLRHTSGIMGRVEQAREVLSASGIVIRSWAEQARKLAELKPARAEVVSYFERVYAAAFEEPKTDRGRSRRSNVLDDWRAHFRSHRNNMDGVDGSMWGAFNAVTDWADHDSNKSATRDERHYSAWFGSAADVKAAAWDKAVELIGA